LLPILHEVQATFGAIPELAQREIADVLNLTAAEVYGVMSFYPDFRAEPAGRITLRLCRAEACKAMGADALAEDVEKRLNLTWGETTPDGAITLQAVYCLGLCACAPAAQVADRLVGRATASDLVESARKADR